MHESAIATLDFVRERSAAAFDVANLAVNQALVPLHRLAFGGVHRRTFGSDRLAV